MVCAAAHSPSFLLKNKNEGILGLDLLPILIGTLPVAALIVPSVLVGSFALLGSETKDGIEVYPWADTAAAISTAFMAGFMLYFNIAAVGAVKDTLEQDKERIDAIPIDETVQEADEQAVKRADAYRRATKWSDVPALMKTVLVLAVLSMIACFYMLFLFGDKAFKDYDLMYTIDEHLVSHILKTRLPHQYLS